MFTISLIAIICILNQPRASLSYSLINPQQQGVNHCKYFEQQWCTCDSIEKLECTNFVSLNKLILHKPAGLELKLSSLTLEPKFNSNQTVVLDNKLDLNTFDFDSTRFELKLNNFDGIELNENPFHAHTLKNLKRFAYFHLNNSTLNLFYRHKSFDYICDLVLMDTNLKPVFSSFKYLFFGHAKENRYPGRICQAAFKNARIDWFHLANLSPTNRFEFIHLNNDSHELIDGYLNARISYFQIQLSHIDCLNGLLLDKHVFKHLERLSIEFSYLYGIERDLFKSFKHLKRLHFWLFNFEEFIRGIFNIFSY